MVNYNVYNYYGMSYLPKTNTKYDTHKSKELKNIYQSMVRHNKQSPLYKFSLSQATQNYALSIKDAAIGLKNISSFLSDDTDTVFNQKVFTASDESVLNVHLNTDDYGAIPEQLELEVSDLAESQRNIGNYVPSRQKSIASGTYELNLKTPRKEYALTLKVSSDTRNIDAQQSIADAINQNRTGLKASVIKKDNQSALRIESQLTGKGSLEQDLQFAFSETNPNEPIISFLGLNTVAQAPANSRFRINDEWHESASNSISINSSIDVDLLKTSDSPVTLQLTPDTDEIIDKVQDFVKSYNHLVKLANDNMDNQKSARKLLNDISRVARNHSNALEASGLTIDAQGYLQTEESLLVQSSKNGQFQALFNDISDFQKDIISTTDRLNLDPLTYIDKVVVTYPNTGKSLPNPYVPSIYSGLLFNDYA